MKSVKIILYKGNKVLLQLRDNKSNISDPNMWSLFGGAVKKGESVKKAIKRELLEEIGYKLTDLKLFSKLAEEDIFSSKINCNISGLKLTEGQAVKFFPVAKLNAIKIIPEYKKVILEFFGSKR